MDQGNKFAGAIGVLSAFCLGAAAGAVVGVLMAPASGEESRKKAALWLKEKRAQGRQELLARKERVEAAIAAGRETYRGHHKEELADVGG